MFCVNISIISLLICFELSSGFKVLVPLKCHFSVARSVGPGPAHSQNPARNAFFDRQYGAKLKKDLVNAGQAGILSYGFLNFAWYTIATAFVWSITRSSDSSIIRGMNFSYYFRKGFLRLVTLLGTVWAGSQVTKPFRMAGAVFLAPFADMLVDKLQSKFKVSRDKIFWIMTATLLSSALLFFILLVTSAAIQSYLSQSSMVLGYLFIPPIKGKYHHSHFSSISTESSESDTLTNVHRNSINNNNHDNNNNQKHGWDSHPKICKGCWHIDKIVLNPEAYNSSKSIHNNDNISAIIESIMKNESQIVTKLYSIKQIILKSNGIMKVKHDDIYGRGWEFTPANRRIVFEINIPSEAIILRFSSELTRVPRVVTRAMGVIRLRHMPDKEEENENLNGIKKIPSSSSRWPVIAKFQMNKLLYGKQGSDRDRADSVKKGLLVEEKPLE